MTSDADWELDPFVAAQRALAEEWGFESFDAGLRSWIATVAIVETGYVGEWDEYANELMARDYLTEVAQRSGPGGQARVAEAVAPWDERFMAATVPEEKGHLPRHDGVDDWWHYRSPRNWRRPYTEELEDREL